MPGKRGKYCSDPGSAHFCKERILFYPDHYRIGKLEQSVPSPAVSDQQRQEDHADRGELVFRERNTPES